MGAVVALSVVFATATLANLTDSPFDAGDGNLILDDETQDWVNAPNRRSGTDLPTGQTDNSFVQGTKEDTAIPVIETGSIPNNKSDLTRFYVANEKVNGDEFLYLAWERVQEPNGTTNMDFEFNQSRTTSANGVTPVRSAGDLLIKYDLAQGGVNPVLGYHLWDVDGPCEASGAKAPCWGPVQLLTGNFEGAVNTVVVTDPIVPTDLSVRTFGEAAINLTDSGILPPGSCQGFGSAYLKSRSSDSFTAALKDFIAPIEVNINNCGSITIIKDVNPEPDGTDVTFSTSGLGANFQLDDDANMTLSNTKTYENQQAGSYSVTESIPSGYDLIDVTCTGDDTADTDDNATALIDLDPGENITCTFTNEKDASITIVKDVNPEPDGTDVTFSTSGLGANFQLDDDTENTLSNEKVYADQNPGAYSVTESIPTGYDLIDVTCTGDDTADTDDSATAVIDLDPGENVICTFTNEQDASITIIKDVNPEPDPTNFVFTGLGGFTLDDDSDNALSDRKISPDLTTGSYVVTETPDANYTLKNIVCSGDSGIIIGTDGDADFTAGDTSVTIDLDEGENVTCTFTNEPKHVVIVIVCHQGTNTLAPSGVTDGTTATTTLSAANLPAGVTEAELCGVAGARYPNLEHGALDLDVNVGTGPH